MSDAGIGALTGHEEQDYDAAEVEWTAPVKATADFNLLGGDDPLAQELANVDALLEQSQRLIDRVSDRT